jgi:signal transduction histidine kinase
MRLFRRLAFQGCFGQVLLEAWGGATLALLLVLSVVAELPPINVFPTFLFLAQIPVLWAVLRLEPAPSLWWKGMGREIVFAAALRLLVFVTAWALVSVFRAEAFIDLTEADFLSDLLLYTACFFPYLAYRLLLKGLSAWWTLSQKRFLWMLVTSHLLTVFILIVLSTAPLWIPESTSIAYYPPGFMANVVLAFTRSVVPRVGISLLFLAAALAVFFPPALAVSYLTSRRFVRRIQDLLAAMKALREGDLGARVTPTGSDEIAELQGYFNTMAAELQQERDKVALLLQNQRELAAVVSHELRTPLSVMRVHLENDLAETSDAVSEASREKLDLLHHETLKLQGLVEDLFTLSQLDVQRLDLECSRVDLTAVVERVVASLKQVAWEQKRVDLSAQLPQGPLYGWADAGRLEQVLSNLVQNAIRHSAPGGIILLQAEDIGERVVIRVIDFGEGIASEDLPHIWERFYRGIGGQGTGRTGIGLSLVKELVEAMGGTVGVESDPGEGGRFWIVLRKNGD